MTDASHDAWLIHDSCISVYIAVDKSRIHLSPSVSICLHLSFSRSYSRSCSIRCMYHKLSLLFALLQHKMHVSYLSLSLFCFLSLSLFCVLTLSTRVYHLFVVLLIVLLVVHDSLICSSWLFLIVPTLHTHDSLIYRSWQHLSYDACVLSCMYLCAMTHACIYVPWLMHAYECHSSGMYMCALTYACICVRWLMQMCHITHPNMTHT